jgi:transcriptional regulator with XRE-family HTH domain
MRLAVTANLHISYLGRLERAESVPSIDTVAHVAAALGVDAADLLREPAGPTSPLPKLRSQVRENVELVIRSGDPVTLQALALISASLARAR